jgi:hypothetical protein
VHRTGLQQPKNSDPSPKNENENAEPGSVMIRRVMLPADPESVLMMQFGQDRNGDNNTGPLNCSIQGRIFL